jgi:hypothetical protein
MRTGPHGLRLARYCRAVISGRARPTSSNQVGSLASVQHLASEQAWHVRYALYAMDNVNVQETSEPRSRVATPLASIAGQPRVLRPMRRRKSRIQR